MKAAARGRSGIAVLVGGSSTGKDEPYAVADLLSDLWNVGAGE